MAKRKRKTRRNTNPKKSSAEQTVPAPDKSAPPAEPRFRGWRGRVVLAGFTVGVPALLFAAVELGLRVSGYGYPTAYFVPWEVDGQSAYVDNLEFTRRFFSPGLEQPPLPGVVPADKEAGTIRVFILGGSAAQGDPDVNFAFSRILRVLLEDRYPGVRFEVNNVAITAVNSHVMLPVARDCARRDPDLFIVYMGNNEVVGPFGAGSVIMPFAGNLHVIRAGLAAKRAKTGQLMDSVLYGLGAKDAPKEWKAMAMFIDKQVRHDDPRMEAVYANYQRNLADIAEVALDAGAGVVLCTLGVNEGDLAPFGSLHPPGFGEEQQAAWQEYFEAGVALEEAGSWTGAIESFSQAEALDGTYAELQFRLGRCARALGRYDEAKRLFALARDLDTLRFRTDSRLNESTRTVAADMAAEGVLLTDVDRLLSEASPNGIPGSELFCDHVHFTFAGNYLIARALLEKVEQALPDSLGATGSGKRDPLTEEECAKRLALTEWDLAQQAHSLYKRVMLAPFTNRCDHDASLAELKERREALRPQLGEAGRTKAIPAYREALRAAPNDSMMRLRLGALLLKHKDPAAAEEELRHVIRRLPQEMMPRVLLSRVLTTQEDYGGAEAIWREMLKVYPNSDSAHLNLALALKRQGDMPGAIEEHGEAIAISPFRPDLHFQFGGTLAAHGDPMAAIEEYRTAIELSPTHSEARLSLGTLLIDSSRQREAIPVLRGLIEQSPSKIEAHLLLGKALWAVNRAKEALAEYREAAAIEPGNATAHQSIALILYTGKDYDGAWAAVQLCRSAGGKLDPKFIAALERDSGRAQ